MAGHYAIPVEPARREALPIETKTVQDCQDRPGGDDA